VKSITLVMVAAILAMPAIAAPAMARMGVTLTAHLTAAQQVPRQVYRAPLASARFAGTLVGSNGGLLTLRWRLAYEKVSSRVTAAYIDFPRSGAAGEVVVVLCSRCEPSSNGAVLRLASSLGKAVSARVGYVVIRTRKNPGGEIRGRITISKA
jgi:hypothetical protein